ncbi:MAG: hypothetical protein LLF97_04955 [Planctomycetaceae bacterium]|nr:hypothetical protein [Planctomycetaceae bacterium]
MDDSKTVDLKKPALAALLAWLLPGLGHWYQGRRAKAFLYFCCIMGLFFLGIYLSSSRAKCLEGSGTIGWGRAVYFSWRDGDHRWTYLCQAAVGSPAWPALIQANRMANHRKVWWNGLMAPPRLPEAPLPDGDPNADQPTPNDLYHMDHHDFELASFFTLIAGLLNVLVIYDAWAGPVASTPTHKKDDEGSSHV